MATLPYSQTVSAGHSVTFTVYVTNSGDVTLKNVGVTDSRVSPCSRTVGNLTAGAVYSYTCQLPAVHATFTDSFTTTGTPIYGIAPTGTSSATVVAGTPISLTLYLPVIVKDAQP